MEIFFAPAQERAFISIEKKYISLFMAISFPIFV